MIKILVVGGAGYIGSHMVKLLGREECQVVTLDNISSGYKDAVVAGTLAVGDMSDTVFLDELFSKHDFDVVMHFASYIQVGESVIHPDKYYQNNFSNTLCLLDAMNRHGVDKFIFSSTAAVYGMPQYTPIDEAHPLAPINPYGRTKLMVEQALADYDRAYGIKSVSLRYFNAAGADPGGQLGERHDPETHLIPLVLQAASGRRSHITVYGEDYPTDDGTCIRDYIHVTDLCQAHWLAIESLLNGDDSQVYNLGNGVGFSVKQIIDTARRVTGKDIPVQTGTRRAGDPGVLVADASLARQELGWQPGYDDLDMIIETAWAWEKLHGTKW